MSIPKNVVGGGLSVVSAIGGTWVFAQFGFRIPPGVDHLFIGALAPLGALAGYGLGLAALKSARWSDATGLALLIIVILALGSVAGYIYYVLVAMPVSPSMYDAVFISVCVAFVLTILTIYMLLSLIGLKLSDS